jgi:hypothetical protein
MRWDQPNSCFLDEHGIMITRACLTFRGRAFPLASLGMVQIEKINGPVGGLLGKTPIWKLSVGTKTDPVPVRIFETEDAALMARIQKAMVQAGAVVGGIKELPMSESGLGDSASGL